MVGGLGRGREPRARRAAYRVGGGHGREHGTRDVGQRHRGEADRVPLHVVEKSVAKGTVTFTIKNGGELEHDFKIAGKTSTKVKPGKSTTSRSP